MEVPTQETQQPQKKVSKYASRIAYDKHRKETDPEYRAKKNAMVNARNKQRYAEDPDFREKVKAYSTQRRKLVANFYKEHKNDFPTKDKMD